MTVIKPEIEAAVLKELDAATQIHGLHNSLPEQYAIVQEEVEEAEEALERITEDMDKLWQCLRVDDAECANYYLHEIADHAVELACEAVQVAAMAAKEITPQAKEAKWEDTNNNYMPFRCSRCRMCCRFHSNFCPVCGCKMLFTDGAHETPKGAEE